MPKRAKELKALEVQRLTKPGLWAVGTVPGLYLQVLDSGARTWVLRVSVGGKRRDMGLGGYPAITLAGAIEKARSARELIAAGSDPIQKRRDARSALRAEQGKSITFEQAAEAYIASHAAGWRNIKHGQQWSNTLATYANPTIGTLRVSDVAIQHVLTILEPIWRTKTETASRVRNRIELVLDWATARGYRSGENPARWRGHLDKLLPKPSKVSKPEHFAAVPIREIALFVEKLRNANGTAARALEFLILTAARSGEVRFATWKEFDLVGACWTVPGDRMKAGLDHDVPLSREALAILGSLPKGTADALLFPGAKGGPLSDMSLSAVMKRMGVDAVPHGFRSTFRDWASECTMHSKEVSEMALAHTVPGKTEGAYRRGDLFQKRLDLMQDWADFVSQPRPVQRGRVVPFRKASVQQNKLAANRDQPPGRSRSSSLLIIRE